MKFIFLIVAVTFSVTMGFASQSKINCSGQYIDGLPILITNHPALIDRNNYGDISMQYNYNPQGNVGDIYNGLNIAYKIETETHVGGQTEYVLSCGAHCYRVLSIGRNGQSAFFNVRDDKSRLQVTNYLTCK